MRVFRNRVIAVLGAALMLLGASDLASYAATGHSLVLGKVNKADKATTITRTTAGPALVLKTKPGSAPFGVTSSAKVGKLNADSVDGLQGSALQTRTRSYIDQSEQERGNSELWTVPVGKGTYLVSYTASLTLDAGTPAAPQQAVCAFQLAGAAYGMTSGLAVGSLSQPYLSGSAAITVGSGQTLNLGCTASGATTFRLDDGGVVRIDVTRVDARAVSSISGHD